MPPRLENSKPPQDIEEQLFLNHEHITVLIPQFKRTYGVVDNWVQWYVCNRIKPSAIHHKMS